MFNSLKNKITLTTVFVIAVFGFLATFHVIYKTKDTLEDLNIQKNSVKAVSNSVNIDNIYDELILRSEILASHHEIVHFLEDGAENHASTSVEEISDYLKNFSLKNNYALVYVLGKDGKVIASSDKTMYGMDLSYRHYFKEAMKDGFSQQYLVGSVTKVPGYYFASRITGTNNEPLGVVAIKYLSGYILNESNELGGFKEMVVDRNGFVVEATDQEKIYKSLGDISEERIQYIKEDKSFENFRIDTLGYNQVQSELAFVDKAKQFNIQEGEEDLIFNVVPVAEGNYYYVTYGTAKDVTEDFGSIFANYGLVILFCALLAFVFIYFIISSLLNPLSSLRKAIENFDADKLDYTHKINTGDELESLNEAFKKMSSRLKNSIFTIEDKVNKQNFEILKKNSELEDQKRAVLNILEDVSEERKITLMEKEKLARILQSIGDGVLVVDSERNIIIFNHIAEKITGYIASEVMGFRYDKLFKFIYDSDDSPNSIIEQVFESGKVMEITKHTSLLNKEGSRVPIADSAAPIHNSEGEIIGCIMVFRDVTQEREIDRQKSEFVSVASHQLRTPLTSIKWFLEMILDGDAGKLKAEQRELIEQVSQSTQRMIDLVNKLLNVSRIESGKVKLEPVPTDLNEIIKNVINELTPLIVKGELDFRDKIEKLPIVTVDPKLIREVLINLLSNAIKYTPIKGKVSLTVNSFKDEILFAVKDTGIGIPSRQQEKIFHKYFRAENAIVRETEGTGMGLYVCKSIIELSGGRIWFESREKKGTTFYFTLPLKGSIINEEGKTLV